MLTDRQRFDAAQLGSEIRWRLEMAILSDPNKPERENEMRVKAAMLSFAIALSGVTVDDVKAAHNAMLVHDIHRDVERILRGNGHDNQRMG